MKTMFFSGSNTEASRMLTECVAKVARDRGVSASTVRAESGLKAEAWALLRKRWASKTERYRPEDQRGFDDIHAGQFNI